VTKHDYIEKIKSKLEKHGRLYFNELQRQTGIPRATLTSKLKELKDKKQITKNQQQEMEKSFQNIFSQI
jgi:DNA-binding HxlR family transcriptional regulator